MSTPYFRRRWVFPRSDPKLVVDGKAWIHWGRGEYKVGLLIADLSDIAKRLLGFFGLSGYCGFKFCRDKQPLTVLNDHDGLCVTCWREVKPLVDALCGIKREIDGMVYAKRLAAAEAAENPENQR